MATTGPVFQAIAEPHASLVEELAPTRPPPPHEWVATATLPEAAALLRDRPQLVRATDTSRWTALHWAARLGRPELVKLLLAAGANPNATDSHGRTPLHDLMDRLRRPLHPDSPPDEVAMVKSGIKAGFAETDTPLPSRYVATATLLIDAGADVNVRDEIGQTPAHWAALGGHSDILRLLIARGAKLDLKDVSGDSPLEIARRYGTVVAGLPATRHVD